MQTCQLLTHQAYTLRCVLETVLRAYSQHILHLDGSTRGLALIIGRAFHLLAVCSCITGILRTRCFECWTCRAAEADEELPHPALADVGVIQTGEIVDGDAPQSRIRLQQVTVEEDKIVPERFLVLAICIFLHVARRQYRSRVVEEPDFGKHIAQVRYEPCVGFARQAERSCNVAG